MDKKLNDLHSQYNKHNYTGEKYALTWCGWRMNAELCTCGNDLRVTHKGGEAQIDTTLYEAFAAFLMTRAPIHLRPDVERIIRNKCGAVYDRAIAITDKEVKSFQRRWTRDYKDKS